MDDEEMRNAVIAWILNWMVTHPEQEETFYTALDNANALIAGNGRFNLADGTIELQRRLGVTNQFHRVEVNSEANPERQESTRQALDLLPRAQEAIADLARDLFREFPRAVVLFNPRIVDGSGRVATTPVPIVLIRP